MSTALIVRRTAALISLLLVVATARPASAQYFGQNKVQYNTFAFQVMKTEHFDIYYYPAEAEGVALAARMAERWHARLERMFAHRLRGRQPLVLYASHPHFEQTNIISGELSEGTGGVTESVRRRIVLPLSGPLPDTNHVIGHELVHAFQFDATTSPEMQPGENGASTLPLWFIEGMAEYLSLGPVDINTAMWVRDAVRHDTLPAVKDLDNGKYFPYRWGQAFWAYVGGRWGDRVIAQMLRVAAVSDVDTAIERVLAIKPEQLSKDWQASMRDSCAAVLAETADQHAAGRTVVEGRPFVSDINVGPAISPDGRWTAFLARRNVFSIDLVVADTATGRIVRRLTRTASDPHYSSIQFIYSSGAWAADSRRLAVATVTAGQPALAVFDALSGVREREVLIPGVDEVLNPTWAPDGRAIAFTGMKQGVTDLFIYDLDRATLRQLTADPYSDLQPAWSPDGLHIAFVTDRFSTDLRVIDPGQYQLALIDPATMVIEEVRAFAAGPHLDPQWAADSRTLYFVGAPDGIMNVYRVSVSGGTPDRLTALATGVSGITASSPAMSVARDGAIAFSLYDGGKYDIRVVDSPAAGSAPDESTQAAVLPPSDRMRSEVAGLLADPEYGLPDARAYPSKPYSPTLSLEAIGQPVVSVGVSRFGPTFGGGLALYFGDMLEDHLLATAVDVSTLSGSAFSAKNIAGEAAYVNRRSRWNWGVIGAQIPYLSGGYQSIVGTTPGGDLVESDQLIIYRQTEQSVSGITAYPFDRARRVEFQGGMSHIAFDQIVTTTTYSLLTGGIYENTTETRSLGRSLTLGTSAAAYVFDTSSFGATSPVRGQRYRLEAAPTFGSINFTGLLADYRRYEMPVSFYTVAARVMHYGRYGGGGEDERLFPLYVGYPELVRGYDVNSIDASECVASATSSCALIDRLMGSRMLVGNVELRFPLLRPFGVSERMYGPLPVEVALFADSGVAWNRGEKPSWFGGAREGVSSAGVALRLNLLGFAVAEIDMARPFQRPHQGWTFAFNLMQGW